MHSQKRAKARFTVGSMNLKNLALAEKPIYGGAGYTPDEYKRKIEWTAHQLDMMECDLIGFQEIFHAQACLDALAETGRLKNATLIVRGETGNSPVVGLATTFPVVSARSIKKIPSTAQISVSGGSIPITDFSRPVLHAVVAIHGVEVDVWVTHLKSKRPILATGEDRHDLFASAVGDARSLVYRATEAAGLRHLIVANRRRTKRPCIVIGDMNDDPRAVPTQIIAGSDPWKKLPDKRKREIWRFRLWDVVELKERRVLDDCGHYTHIFNGHYDRLDGIFVSNDFHPECPARIGRVEEVRVFNDHLRDATISHVDQPRWESDHGQVTAHVALE